MKVRRGGARWFSRTYAFAMLGLAGTGALHPISLHGVRIRRGGVRLFDRLPRRTESWT